MRQYFLFFLFMKGPRTTAFCEDDEDEQFFTKFYN